MPAQTLRRCPRCGEQCAQDATTCSGCRYTFETVEASIAQHIANEEERARPAEGFLSGLMRRFRRAR